MVQYVFANAPATPVTLAGGGINSSVTTIVVATGRGADLPAPSAGELAILRIEDEYVTYTTRTTDTLTGVTRGFSGSTAASHAAGVEIRNVATKEVLDAIGTGTSTIYTSAYASPPASPDNGDLWLPSDSLYTAYRSGGAWVYKALGFTVTLPPAVTGNAATGFAWINQGDATADESAGGVVLSAPANAGNTIRQLVTNAPATPYTIWALLFMRMTNTNFSNTGLVFRQSSDGKLSNWVLAGGSTVLQQHYSGPTGGFVSQQFGQEFVHLPIWLWISDDGTNRTHGLSHDGLHKGETLFSEGRTTYLIADQVGLAVNPPLATYVASAYLVSWRVSA